MIFISSLNSFSVVDLVRKCYLRVKMRRETIQCHVTSVQYLCNMLHFSNYQDKTRVTRFTGSYS